MRILFITATRIGDAVLSTGLLAHLVATYPTARFTIACGRDAAPLFAAVPRLERVIEIVKKPYAGHWIALWRECVPHAWEVVVDLRRSAIAWLLRAKVRRVFPGDDRPVHKVVSLARALDLDTPPAPRLWLGERQRAAAAELVPPGPPVLALGPGANWPPKRWPPRRFAALAERITAADGILPGGRVAVLGGPGDRDEARHLLEAIPPHRLIDLVGRIDVLTVSAVLRRCALFVGNDSGLMHIAAASGIPTLGLFGPSREDIYGPWGPLAASLRTRETWAELGGEAGFPGAGPVTLMDGLTVEAAEAAARALWQRSRAAAA